MNLFWHLCALFATQCCLGAGAGDADSGLCNSGELPAPKIFLNATLAQVGDWVSVRCMPLDTRASNFFFCKNGHIIASHRALPQNIAYTLVFPISEHSAGQYSCGYQKKDRNNQQKNSFLSAAWNFTVLPGNPDPTSGNSSSTVQNWMIISGVAGGAVLILIPLIYLLIKKTVSHWRISREEDPRENGNHVGSVDQFLYENIDTFETLTSDVSFEDTSEWMAPSGTRESMSSGVEFGEVEYGNLTSLNKSAEECPVQLQDFTCSFICT
ncbi:uncharacterized protein [Tiliqua scincoides]|uniref:uncharacterized protein isoform X2 n=1 Tax=Tiliqua scincoides TaxID=71010 RepID=UPI0034618D64